MKSRQHSRQIDKASGITFILLLSVCISSCRCDKEHTYTLTETSRQYFSNFLEGSYWVYENYDDPADVDTLSLVNRTTGLAFDYTEKPCDGDYKEYVRYKLVSSRTKDTIDVDIRTNVNIDLYQIQGKYHNLSLSSRLQFDKNSGQFSSSERWGDTVTVYNSYTVKDKPYSDVVRTTSLRVSPSYPENGPLFYYARHEGLIEFRIHDQSANANKRYWLKNAVIVR